MTYTEPEIEAFKKTNKYLADNGLILANPIDGNTTNLHKLIKYLDDMPNALENEFKAKFASLNNINALQKSDIILSQNIEGLKHQFNRKINRSIASQMAVSNLFQPYSIGKFNLSAATGGYKSEYSLAVGTGYRFNQHIAVRASASFVRGGSVAYGAGVNFEY